MVSIAQPTELPNAASPVPMRFSLRPRQLENQLQPGRPYSDGKCELAAAWRTALEEGKGASQLSHVDTQNSRDVIVLCFFFDFIAPS